MSGACVGAHWKGSLGCLCWCSLEGKSRVLVLSNAGVDRSLDLNS